jgi:cytochrome c
MIALLALGLLQAEPAVADAASLAELEARGRRVYLRCQACHALEQGAVHKVGPNLYGFLNEPAASREGFTYSTALSQADIVWDEDALDAFLERPAAIVPGTTMAFAGLRREADRDAVIAYLKAETAPQE